MVKVWFIFKRIKMPLKKRRKSNNENIKEKKAIATRLMVMSLKIDDYIYKNKPISLQEAQQYVEEIATYKFKCGNDVRSLQVIEKLTLFMKSIINENTMCHDSNENLNTESAAIEASVTRNTNDTKIIPNNAVTDMKKEDCIDEINIIDLTISENDVQIESPTEEQNITMKTISNVSSHNSVINLNGDTNYLRLPSIVNENNRYNFELNRDSSILIQNGQNKNTHFTIAGNYIKDFKATNIIDNNSNHIDNNNAQSPSIINERNGYGIGCNSDGSIPIQNEQNKNTHLAFAQNYTTNFEATNVIDNNSNQVDYNNVQSPSIINERNGCGMGCNSDGSIVVQNEQNKNTSLIFAQNYTTDIEATNFIDNISNQIDSNIQSPSLINERNGYEIGLNCDSPIVIQNGENQNRYVTIPANNISNFAVTNVIESNSSQIGNNRDQNNQIFFSVDGKNIENKQNLIIKDVKTCKCLKDDNEINVITPKVDDKKDKIEVAAKSSKRKPKEKTVRTKKAKSTNIDKNQNINIIRKKKGETTKKNNKRSTKTNLFNTLDSNSSVKNNVLPKLDREKERTEDLSWIENLKYVREVSKEEYVSTKTLEETFWNDLSLPVDFNLNDFDYID